MNYPWFRMYSEAVDDEKLRLLAFEDRWHFVALLCLKSLGTLDSGAPFLERRVALKLGLQLPQLDELKRRLSEVGLIDDQFQPVKWEERQFKSDHNSAERKRIQREKERGCDSHNNVTTINRDSHVLEQNRTEQIQSKKVASRSRRVPTEFQPDLTFAESLIPDIDASAEAAKFRDWEFKTPRSDWPAVWRTWLSNCRESGKYARKASQKWQ